MWLLLHLLYCVLSGIPKDVVLNQHQAIDGAMGAKDHLKFVTATAGTEDKEDVDDVKYVEPLKTLAVVHADLDLLLTRVLKSGLALLWVRN